MNYIPRYITLNATSELQKRIHTLNDILRNVLSVPVIAVLIVQKGNGGFAEQVKSS